MRRSVVTTMSGVSLVVVGLGLRAGSATPHAVVAGTAPVGVVAAGPPAPGSASPTRPATRRTAAARPRRTATHAAATRAAALPVVHHRRTATASPASSPSPKAVATQTYTVTGPAVESGYGPVQVQLQIRSHRIVSADAIEYPQGGSTDRYKSSYAIPQLDRETLSAQSAQIDTVSGATYTSQAYISSLQAALDQAHRAGIF